MQTIRHLLLLCSAVFFITTGVVYAEEGKDSNNLEKVENFLKKYREDIHFEKNKGQLQDGILYRVKSPLSHIRFKENGVSFGIVEILESEQKPIGLEDKGENDYEDPIKKQHEIRRAKGVKAYEPSAQLEKEKDILPQKGFVWNLNFIGANTSKQVISKYAIPSRTNYFRGSSLAASDVTNVNSYKELWYEGIYDGIDLRFYSKGGGEMEYDYIVYPSGSIEDISFELEGVEHLDLAPDGDIIIKTPLGDIRKSAPYTYQVIDGVEVEVNSKYVLEGSVIKFALEEDYNKSYPLIIDPTLIRYATFFGGSSSDYLYDIKADADGNLYATGRANSSNFPTTTGVFQTTNNGSNDAVLFKLDANGTPIFSTYIGGNNSDYGYNLELDATGVYINGYTYSGNFPITVGAYMDTIPCPTGSNCQYGYGYRQALFVSKLSLDGSSLIYSTFLGGSEDEYVARDGRGTGLYNGDMYVMGETRSGDTSASGVQYPVTANAYLDWVGASQIFTTNYYYGYSYNNQYTYFITRLNSTGTGLVASTLFKLGSYLTRYQLEVDPTNGDAIFMSRDNSQDSWYIGTLPAPVTTGAYDTTIATNEYPYFVVRMNSDLSAINACTYFNNNDERSGTNPEDLLVDNDGNVYLVGETDQNIPTTAGAFMSVRPTNISSGYEDLFVVKFDPGLENIIYGTYIGGENDDEIEYATINNAGEVLFSGNTDSEDYPVTDCAWQDTIGRNTSGSNRETTIISKLNATGSALVYSSYYGLDDERFRIAEGEDGAIYLLEDYIRHYKTTSSNSLYNYPVTVDAFQTQGGRNSSSYTQGPYIAKLIFDIEIGENELDTLYQETCKNADPYEITGSDASGDIPGGSASDIIYRNQTVPQAGASGAFDVSWQFSIDSMNWSAIPGAIKKNYQPQPTTITTYFRRVVTEECSGLSDTTDVFTLYVNQYEAPTIDIGDPQAICEGGSAVLGGSPTASGGDSDNYTYNWLPDIGLNDASLANPTASPSNGAVYTLQVLDANGCDVRRQTVVTVARAEAGMEQGICEDNFAGVQIGSPPVPKNPPFVYTWTPAAGLSDPNIAQPIANPLDTTLYFLSITGAGGCPSIDSVLIYPTETLIDAGIDKFACGDDIITLGTPAVPNYSYQWSSPYEQYTYGIANNSLMNAVISLRPTILPADSLNPVPFYLRVTDLITGCSTLDTAYVEVSPVPYALNKCFVLDSTLESTGRDSIGLGDTLYLGANQPAGFFNPSFTYSWTPTTGVSDPTAANPYIIANGYSSYTVTASAPGGCSTTAVVAVGAACISGCSLNNSTRFCTSSPGETVNLSFSLSPLAGYCELAHLTYRWEAGTGLTDTIEQSTNANPSVSISTTASPSQNTIYRCILRDTVDNLFGVHTFYVSVPDTSLQEAGPDQTICNGETVTIGAAPLSGYTYEWAPNDSSLSNITSSSPIASPLNTTTYYLTMEQSGTRCIVRDEMNVFVRTPVIDAGPDIEFCGGSTFQLGSPPSPNQIYTWEPNIGLLPSGNIAQPSIELQVSVSFVLTTTDTIGGCSLTDTINITKIDDLGADAGDDGTYCSGDPAGYQLGPDSIDTGFNYTWLPASSLDDPLSINPIATPDQTTLYIVYVTHPDRPGCNATDQVLVNVAPPPTVTVTAEEQICLGGSVAIGPTVSAGMTYYWEQASGLNPADSASANPVVSPTETTSYNLTVTDINGCSSDATVTVVVDIPIADAGADTTTCQGGDGIILGLTSIPGFSYSWNPSVGLDDAFSSNPTANPSTNIEYVLTVTNSATGCMNTDTVSVSLLQGPLADAGDDIEVCEGTGGSMIGTSDSSAYNYVYSWSPAAGLDDATSPTPMADPTSTTTYVLTVTNTLLPNCPSTSEVAVTFNVAPVLSSTGGTICAGASIQIGETSQTGLTYSWAPMTGLDDSTASNPTASPMITTIYTITATDDNTSCSSSMDVEVIVNSVPQVDAGTDEEVCLGASTTIGFEGGAADVTYSWSPTVGLASANASETLVTLASDTMYVLTATNSITGCAASDTVNLTLNSSAVPTFSLDNESVCIGEDVVIGPSGLTGVSYSWSPATGLDDATSGNPTATLTGNQTYILTVTDNASGCSDTAHTMVTVNALPTANAGADQPLCPSATSGVQIGDESTTGYTYSWDPTGDLDDANLSNPTASPTATTTYTVTVTDDATGCEATDEIVVTIQNTEPDFTLTDETICEDASTTIGPSGLTGVTYEWSPNAGLNSTTIAEPTASPSSTTTYSLTVTDIATGCATTEDVEVAVLIPEIDAGDNSYSLCTGETVQLGSTNLSGYTYSWSPTTGLDNANSATPNASISAGSETYTLTATSPEGCVGTDQTTVNYNEIIANAGPNQVICQQASVEIGTPALPNYDYFWSPTTGLNDATIAQPTATVGTSGITYTLTVRNNANACIASTQVIVGVVSIPAPTAEAGSDIILCEGETAILGAPPIQADSGNTYAWSPTSNLSNPFVAEPTIDLNSLTSTTSIEYTLTVANADGCSNTDKVIITRIVVPADAGSDRYYCYDANGIGNTNINAVNYGSNYDYSWSPSTNLSNASILNPSANPSSTTTYTLTVTDTTGCTMTDEVVIGPDTLNPYIATVTDGTICSGDAINIGGTALPGITYDWFPTTLDDRYSANPLASPTSNTNYRLISRTENGCQATLYAYVTVLPALTVDAGADATICEGSGAVSIGTSSTIPGASYSWNPPIGLSDASSPNPTALPSLTTTYTLTVSVPGSSCTPASDQVRISLAGLPTANGGGNVTFCEGTGAIIGGSAQPGYSYNWSPATGLLNTTNAQTIANPSTTTTYVLTVTYDNTGCSNTDTLVANVQPLDEASLMIADYCEGSMPSVANIGTSSAGYYILNPDPMDGTMIDGSTGIISGGVAGTTYRAQYITTGVCPTLATDEFSVIALDYSDNPSLTIDTVCAGEVAPNAILGGIAGGGTFSFNPPAIDGAQIDANLGIISDATIGSVYTVEYVTSGQCPVNIMTTVPVYNCDGVNVTGSVWYDSNGNGLEDPNEDGLDSLLVTLYDRNNQVVAMVYTDDDGNYEFPFIPAGDYYVEFESPTALGLVPSPETIGGSLIDDDKVNGANATETFTVGTTDVTDVDAGFMGIGEIGDYVWNDTNGDGVQDVGEMGISGVGIIIRWHGPDGIANTLDDNVYTALTNAMGYYQVKDLPMGNYTVSVFTGPGTPIEVFIPSTSTSQTVTLTPIMPSNQDQDFGFNPVSVSGTIWYDTDGDGLEGATEQGFGNVMLTLWNATTNMPTSFTAVTDNNGAYSFDAIANGNYFVVVDIPNGYDASPETAGGSQIATIPTNGVAGSTTVFAVTGADMLNVDAGLIGTGIIGDYVWLDDDNDGVPNFSENGIEGVMITATWAGPDGMINTGDEETFTTTTNISGNYLFENLPMGDYEVVLTTGSGTPLENLFSTTGGNTASVSLNTANTKSEDIDFGYNGFDIGGVVWNDGNADGSQDISEFGISDIIITAIWYGPDGVYGTADDVPYSTLTDFDGNYLFENLPLGDYEIIVVDGTGSVLDGSTSTTGGSTQTTILGMTNQTINYGYNNCQGVELFVDFADGDVQICGTVEEKYTITESLQSGGILVYQWTVTGGTIVGGGGPFDNSVTVDWTTAGIGTIQLIGININGCEDTLSTDVTINPIVVANAGIDATIIEGNTVTLGGNPSATGGSGGFAYNWSPISSLNTATASNPIATPTTSTTYTLTVRDANGCSAEDEIYIEVTPQVECKRDGYEPNDTRSRAKSLTAFGFGKTLICPLGDEDWFVFSTTTSKRKVKIQLLSLPENYKMSLYDANGNLETSSDNSGTQSELIEYPNLAVGTYYVKVEGNNNFNAKKAYTLSIRVDRTTVDPVGGGGGGKTIGWFFKDGKSYERDYIKSYPNPTKDYVIVEFNTELEGDMQVSITDVYGRTVAQTNHNVQSGFNKIQLDTKALNAGTYFINLSKDDYQKTQKCIIIND